MKKLLFNLKFLIVFLFIMISYNSIHYRNTYASVGNTFKKMNAKYHMKQIPLSSLYILDPYLIQFTTKNSGIKAYKFNKDKIRYEAVFNYNNVCWEEFALAKNTSVFPLKSLIGKTLYKYPIFFKVLIDEPMEYEKFKYGRSIGKVIYIIQYIYGSNSILEEAIMPSMAPR